jgi:hypothetical protein
LRSCRVWMNTSAGNSSWGDEFNPIPPRCFAMRLISRAWLSQL